ncbi:MAG: corrinoid protein [Verrucomicrobiota bacterium]|nr:corrinoid protein [Verrucomicrobiota bacterium]
MSTLAALQQAVIIGKAKDAKVLTQKAIEEKLAPATIVDQALVPAMAEVGERFKRNEIFVPEMLVAARAMKECMALMEPLLVAAGAQPRCTTLIGTVQGDLHDIGKNLVAIMWKGANVKVIDIGTNVSPEKFVAAVREHKPLVVGLSTLLTTTMPAMTETVKALRASDVPPVKIMVGGAPITEQFAKQIGADAYSPDAASAVDVLNAMISSTKVA